MTYNEQDFEDHIVEHLVKSGYEQYKPADFDKDLCLIKEEVIGFIIATQTNEYAKLKKQYGDDTQNKFLYRLSQEISKKGTLQVLRKGIKDRGCKFRFAYFKPANKMNPGHQILYNRNGLSVIRQLKYSKRNENSIDIVIFINGIPIVTAEIKNSLTGQFVQNAVKQYKHDRDPKEQLLEYKRCLVHFAVGNEEVFMTTKLNKEKTYFLPFNKDTENPVNPNGHKTAYLWEDIFMPDTLLDLINNYLHIQTDTEKYYDKDKGLTETTKESFIFPRFHQLDVVRKLLDSVRTQGAGNNYLIQHSAGSGKSNSIAWLSHQLASLYRKDSDTERLFDSILVITDRKNLDRQLQNTIKQFEQTKGVVKPIEKHSGQLREALQAGKDIIISTLQKFPVISKEMSGLKGNRFAVIIDEVHSSTGGESAKHLKKVLSGNLETAENEDNLEFDLEDKINEEIEIRGKQLHISYFGFTATPKGKTLELFGNKNEEGKFLPFHSYSMKQAIKERFILDVLKNYTTFKRYFKLVKKIDQDKKYSKKKAMRLLTSYVDLQPHAIEMKTNIILDHFMEKTVNEIAGKARAMFATRSRLHAVKYYIAFKRIMKERGIKFKPLVAFSGTIEEHTENSLNGLPPKVKIPDAFKTPEYRILIVANKFQTGFDEPLLHTMYVDKKLGGVQAVQTLSRLNRTTSGKTDTLVLDFVNEAEDILLAFQPYYKTTFLEEETDPNKLYDLQSQLEEYEIFTESDVAEFAEIFFNPKEKLEMMQPILDRVVSTFRNKDEDEREDFRALLQSFIRLYGFISQLVTFADTGLEKLFVFCKNLNRKLPKRDNRLPYEVRDAVDLDSFRIQKTYEGSLKIKDDDGELKGISSGIGKHIEEEKEYLSNIIKALNDIFGTDLTNEDKIDVEMIKKKVAEHEELKTVMENKNNTVDNKKYKFNEVLDNIILDFVHTKLNLYKKLTDKNVNEYLKKELFKHYQKEFERKAV